MTGMLDAWLGGARKTRVDKIELHLISAHALLQAQQEAGALAAGDAARLGLCVNACILARAAKQGAKAVFSSGEDVLKRVPAQTIERWAGEYLALCERENPSCCQGEHDALRQALENAPYERLKWKVLRALGVLPSEQRAREMTDGDYLYCVLQLMLDENEQLDMLCPSCREKAREKRCPACGGAVPEQNAGFDMERYEELRRQ